MPGLGVQADHGASLLDNQKLCGDGGQFLKTICDYSDKCRTILLGKGAYRYFVLSVLICSLWTSGLIGAERK